MRYFGFMPNDFLNGKGVSVSFWTAGCPHHCRGCQNQDMWNYEDGAEIPREDIITKINNAIIANGIKRNFSVLGGEPLAPYNYDNVLEIVKNVRAQYPDIQIYLWTGYNFDEVKDKEIMNYIDVLIDGKFVLEKRDITLWLRGSSNQNIYKKGTDF